MLGFAHTGPAFSQVLSDAENIPGCRWDARVPEVSLRKGASKTVEPVYPESAIGAKVTGLVVSQICVPAGSTTAQLRILTAPNQAISQTVKTAVSQWKFTPWIEKGKAMTFGGKLFFYFVQQNGSWKVLSPAESFYVGPEFTLTRQSSAVAQSPPGPPLAGQPPPPVQIDAAELTKLLAARDSIFIDTRPRWAFERAHIRGFLNMAPDELPERVPHELPKDKTLVIHCMDWSRCDVPSKSLVTALCQGTHFVLYRMGYSNVKYIADELATLAGKRIPVVGTPCK